MLIDVITLQSIDASSILPLDIRSSGKEYAQ
jgi:hypothetical protein